MKKTDNISLSTKFVGLELKNPLIVSSSSLTMSLDTIKKCEESGAGAVVLKSIFEEQFIDKQKTSKIDHDYIKNLYQQKTLIDLEDYLSLIKEAKKNVDIPVIASLNCISNNPNYSDYLKQIEKAGADALEVNIAIMPKNFKQTPYEIETHLFKIIYEVNQSIKIPVIAKIGPFYTSIPRIAKGLKINGASAIVLFNRFYQPEIDTDDMRFCSKNRYSSPDDLNIALRWISILYNEIDAELVGATGVHDGLSAVKLLLAGATVIEFSSVLYLKGIDYVQTVIDGLRDWMKNNKYNSIDDFRGLLSQKNTKYPEFFERYEYLQSMERFE